MAKFEQEAKDLLQAVGGKENIAAVSHCATRLRFVLNDETKADKKKIESISAVKGIFTNAGQFQVIIGNEVPTFYNDFVAVSGIEGVSKEAAKIAAKKNQNLLQRLVGVLAEIFTPILPAIIVGGLILGFRNILEAVPMSFLDGQTIVDVSSFWAAVNRFLWLPGEAIFHFLPVAVTWSITRRMGGTQILGIVLGITLVSPQLMNAYGVNSASASDIAAYTIDFGFAELFLRGYQAQVIPAMLAGFTLVYLERFFRKYTPEALSMILVPFFSLLPAIIIAHAVLGPIGWWISEGVSTVVNAGLTSSVSWLFAILFGALYAPLVITGLHHTTLAIDFALIGGALQSTNLWPMIALSNIAQGAAVVGIIIANRGNKKEEQVSVPAAISAWLGVTEPAMFGINLKYMFPFVAAMIGSASAALVVTLFGVRANAVGVGGLPGILAIRGQDMGIFALAMLIAIVVPIMLTLFFHKSGKFGKAEEQVPELESGNEVATTISKTVEISAVLNGKVFPLTEAKDPAFASGTMGVGVIYDEIDGELFAPFDGTVATLFPTKHAIGIVSDEGVEVLVHIGIDTVNLQGEHFEALVQQGEKVKRGDKLVKFDVKAIKEAGYLIQTPVIITNSADYQVDVPSEGNQVKIGEVLMTATKI